MKILIFVLLVLLLNSCISERKIIDKIKATPERYCSFCPEITTHTTDTIIKIDTLRVETTDTTFYGSFIDLAVFSAMAKCDSLNRVQLDSLKIHSNKGTGYIYIKDNKLIGLFKSKHDSLMIINNKLSETITININTIDSLKTIKNSIKEISHIPFWIYLIFGFLAAIIFYLFFKRK